ncbi:hypothetical protein [Photorhabdus namnaonensis]|uniref:Uncharacterized protein n=1 Tax=Photorhabdus namnaonensis TaxID=1851568 RepID=A0A1B8YN64_9GAMM|nr:hypothetical protein [Photorhabdus namnaonensis]OCA56553.1 hypothetical protein Phpb_00284 [Photorhabdus namnaonensis]
MKKRNSRKKSRPVVSKKTTNTLMMSGDFIIFCEKLTQQIEIIAQFSPDYYFCKAIIAREEKKFQIERQCILNLLRYTDSPKSFLIEKLLNNQHEFICSEQVDTILSLIRTNTASNVYIQIIKSFILSGTKQKIAPYFNCLMGYSQNFNEEQPYLDIDTISDNQLLMFYEETHRVLLDNSNNADILKKLTNFIFSKVTENTCQSLLFFISYFNIKSNPEYAIEIANRFLEAPNLSTDNTSYLPNLAYNTALTAIDFADINEAYFWLEYINNEERSQKIKNEIDSLEEKIHTRSNHPLNPENIPPKYINDISTKDIIMLCSYLDGCGDDWGLKELNRSGKYIFPSKTVTIETFKSLALNGLVKMSQTSFNSFEDKQLNDFNDIIFNAKFHTNIHGVGDSKLLALPILLEELDRRNDKLDASSYIWKVISTGYFYSAFEYYLNNVSDTWAREFTLNEKTIERISSSSLSAKDLSYIARYAIGYAAGQHSIGGTKGNKHTCNVLIGSINRNFDWVDTDKFYPKTFPRDKKQPVMSSERIMEKICGITPDDLYNLPPQTLEHNQNEFSEDEF